MRLRKHARPAAPAEPPAVAHRPQFQRDLDSLEAEVKEMAVLARRSIELSMDALSHSDASLSEAVIAGDDDLDRRNQQIEARVVELIARQQPVASDLRLLISLIQVSLHLERIGDMAVNVAEATQAATGLPTSPDIVERLGQMSERTTAIVDLAVDAFTHRDRATCEQLGALDDEIDQLTGELVAQIVTCRDDEVAGVGDQDAAGVALPGACG